jgi:exopolysaccharide production protein ExoQ
MTFPNTRERMSAWCPTALAAVSLLLATGGPAFVATRRWNLGIDFYNWPYAYSTLFVVAVGAVMLPLEIKRRGAAGAWTRPELFVVVMLAGLCVLALASAIWSVNVAVTPDRAFKLAGTTAFAVWFGRGLPIDRQITALFGASGAATLVSAWAHLRDWPTAVDEYGSWLGMFPNRNGLGAACGLAIIASVGWAVVRPSRIRVPIATGVAVIAAVLLSKSGSVTPVVGLACGGATVAGVVALRPLRRLHPRVDTAAGVAGVVGAIVLAVLAWRRLQWFTELFGRDATLTSRRTMWHEVRTQIALRPWKGFGYDAFWSVPDLVLVVETNVGGRVVYAHNTFLEITLGVGWPGLVLLALATLVGTAGCFRWAWVSGSRASLVWLALLVYALANNAMESGSYSLSTTWLLLVAGLVVGWRHGSAPTPEAASTERDDVSGSAAG